MKSDMLGNTPKRADLVGVYEQLDDSMTTPLAQYTDNPEENESTVASTTKGLIKQFEQMNAGEDEKVDRQWREFWLNRNDIKNLPYS